MKCKDCPYHNTNECKDALDYGYCPEIDYGECYSSALAREIEEQNMSYTISKLKSK